MKIRKGKIMHDFYTDHDENVPVQIQDRNGQVVLALCKRCGQAENELQEKCRGTK